MHILLQNVVEELAMKKKKKKATFSYSQNDLNLMNEQYYFGGSPIFFLVFPTNKSFDLIIPGTNPMIVVNEN